MGSQTQHDSGGGTAPLSLERGRCLTITTTNITMTTTKQTSTIAQPPLVGTPPAPKDRAWLKSYVSPGVWALIAEPPQIVPSKRRAKA